MHSDVEVIESFRQNGIDSHWAEYFLNLEVLNEEEKPDLDVYMSYLDHAHVMMEKENIIPVSNVSPHIEPVRGMEVGDDRRDESNSPTGLAVSLVTQESVFKMKTSKEDTFISKERSNFCEVTTLIPRTSFGSLHTMRKTNHTNLLEYVDTMPLRIITDVSKGGQGQHSSSVAGKSSLAGPKQAFCREELQEEMFMANLLQDGSLLTSRSPEPKYLPTIMGGSGAPPLYGDSRNLFLYMMTYRGGGHSRVYGTCTAEIIQCLKRLEETGIYQPPALTMQIRMKEEYLRVTYKEKVFIPSKEFINIEKETPLPPPLYESGQAQNELASGEQRLLAAKLLISRSSAEVEAERTRRNYSILFGTIDVNGAKMELASVKRRQRANFEGALTGNSAVARMLEKRANDSDALKLMKSNYFKPSIDGVREFTTAHADWITGGCKSDTYDLRDIRKPEDMYVRAEVSTEEEMKVSGIGRLWVKDGKAIITQTRSTVGLWKVSENQYKAAEEVLAELIRVRNEMKVPTLPRSTVVNTYYNYRENSADDVQIIQRAVIAGKQLPRGVSTCILISQDTKLAERVAQRSGLNCLRISPSLLIPLYSEDSEEEIGGMDGNPGKFSTVIDPNGMIQMNKVVDIYVDTGSLQHALQQFAVEVLPTRKAKKELYRTRLVETGISDNGHRYEKIGYRKTVQVRKIALSGNLKDWSNRRAVEWYKAELPFRTKLKSVEQYREPTGPTSEYWKSLSESGISFANAWDYYPETENGFDFRPQLSPSEVD